MTKQKIKIEILQSECWPHEDIEAELGYIITNLQNTIERLGRMPSISRHSFYRPRHGLIKFVEGDKIYRAEAALPILSRLQEEATYLSRIRKKLGPLLIELRGIKESIILESKQLKKIEAVKP